jgi:hypothetical protein
MNLGNFLKDPYVSDSEFSFLAFVEDIKIGPSKSDIDMLMEITLHADVTHVMKIEDIALQIRNFTKLIYARFPRFAENFRVTYKRFNMAMVRSRILFIIRYN